jgi:hypothetical protein
MSPKNNDPKARTVEGHYDIEPIPDDMLDSVSGAGNPWLDVKGVPLQPITEDVLQRNPTDLNAAAKFSMAAK